MQVIQRGRQEGSGFGRRAHAAQREQPRNQWRQPGFGLKMLGDRRVRMMKIVPAHSHDFPITRDHGDHARSRRLLMPTIPSAEKQSLIPSGQMGQYSSF